MDTVNRYAKQRGRVIDFKEILYGYRRVQPPLGVDHVLDLLLVYRRYRGRKMTVPARKHVYVQQPFLALEVDVDDEGADETRLLDSNTEANRWEPDGRGSTAGGGGAALQFLDLVQSRLKRFVARREAPTRRPTSSIDPVVHFVLPLSKRARAFRRFLDNYKEVCLKRRERTRLVVVLFDGDSPDAVESLSMLDATRITYPDSLIDVVRINATFSRARALDVGARHSAASGDALLFFIDVDMAFSAGVLPRIRQCTRRGRQVYFPVVFSQYQPPPGVVDDPDTRFLFGPDLTDAPLERLHSDLGYWRAFGFGIVSIYNSDLVRVGSYDTQIEGWGLEDVDLYDRVVQSKDLTVFRAPDPGLIHVFHETVCDASLKPKQWDMCLGSRASNYGSQHRLAELVYNRSDVLLRSGLSPSGT